MADYLIARVLCSTEHPLAQHGELFLAEVKGILRLLAYYLMRVNRFLSRRL